jgi:carbon storage regulator
MLVLSRKKDEKIMIGTEIEVWVVDVKGDQVKIGIKAPKNVKVYRHEVYEEIQAANKAAVASQLDQALELFPELGKEPHESNG